MGHFQKLFQALIMFLFFLVSSVPLPCFPFQYSIAFPPLSIFPPPLLSGQSETHYPNGCKDIHFPDGTLRHMYPNGEEKVEFVDGVIQYMYSNGNKTIDFPDGQKETHTKEYKVHVDAVFEITSKLHFTGQIV